MIVHSDVIICCVILCLIRPLHLYISASTDTVSLDNGTVASLHSVGLHHECRSLHHHARTWCPSVHPFFRQCTFFSFILTRYFIFFYDLSVHREHRSTVMIRRWDQSLDLILQWRGERAVQERSHSFLRIIWESSEKSEKHWERLI